MIVTVTVELGVGACRLRRALRSAGSVIVIVSELSMLSADDESRLSVGSVTVGRVISAAGLGRLKVGSVIGGSEAPGGSEGKLSVGSVTTRDVGGVAKLKVGSVHVGNVINEADGRLVKLAPLAGLDNVGKFSVTVGSVKANDPGVVDMDMIVISGPPGEEDVMVNEDSPGDVVERHEQTVTVLTDAPALQGLGGETVDEADEPT